MSMPDTMGGSTSEKRPAWELRQQKLRQQRQKDKRPPALNENEELGGSRSSYASRQRANDELGGTNSSRQRANDELNGTNSSSGSLPAWKLLQQAKARRGHNFDDSGSDASMSSGGSTRSTVSFYSRSTVSSHPSRSFRPVSRVPGAPDPALPPAFRAAFKKQQQRKKNTDDFLSLDSVHSRSRTDACSTLANTIGSDSTLSDDDDDDDDRSFDDEDSFASLGSDADEDDEAHRESRNQMARLRIEDQSSSKRVGKSRFKKKTIGAHGTPLDFIAE